MLKQIATAALMGAMAWNAYAQTYTLPNPEVATSLTNGDTSARVAISDPAYTGGVLTGPVTRTAIYRQGPYGPYFWGYNYTGSLTDGASHTASYEQDWQRWCSGGRDYHCWYTASEGSLVAQ